MKPTSPRTTDITLVDVVYGDDRTEVLRRTQALIRSTRTSRSSLPTTNGVAAAARYVSTSEAKGKVSSLVWHPERHARVRQGRNRHEFALWNPRTSDT